MKPAKLLPSPLSQINVGAKLLATLFIIIPLLVIDYWTQLMVDLLLLLFLSGVAGILGQMLQKIKPFIFLCLMIVLVHSLLNPENTSYVYFFGLEGLEYGITVALRLLCIIITANFLLLTTETGLIIRWVGNINQDLGLIMGLVMSVLPVMQNQMITTLEVQKARGLRLDSIFKRFSAYIAVIVPVIVKSIIRANNMSQLLLLRGYGQNVTKEKWENGFKEWVLLSLVLIFFAMNFYLYLVFKY